MMRRPPRSTQSRSSAASDVYKRQFLSWAGLASRFAFHMDQYYNVMSWVSSSRVPQLRVVIRSCLYTHLRAHETVLDLVCRLLLEKKKNKKKIINIKNKKKQ
eukprot:TRINITY_DN4276_c0_g1_i1.p1 TRINITY_DN4276_c0_g1~~TRINITY_DN4276_c0_g1_i1.p1  ORF type:complete len:102 (-),score=39.36 TRINITY_DN4276_c0_g1_i1:17-322(-)